MNWDKPFQPLPPNQNLEPGRATDYCRVTGSSQSATPARVCSATVYRNKYKHSMAHLIFFISCERFPGSLRGEGLLERQCRK